MNTVKNWFATASTLALLATTILTPCPAPAQVALPTQASVTTYLFDHYQSGVNAAESILTPANVKAGSFGALFSSAIDGQAYAQPLYLSNLTVAGAQHNVAVVATMHDSVYAFDADSGATLWQTSFISASASAVPLIVLVPSADRRMLIQAQ